MKRWCGGGLLGCLVAAVLLAPVPAAAHDSLVSVSPADGSTVTASPDTVVLEFSDSVEPIGTAVVVRGSDGRVVSQGSTAVSGRTVSQRVQPLDADGTYEVSYRVVSADGHPVSGTSTFLAAGLGPQMSSDSTAAGLRTGTGGLGLSTWVVVGGLVGAGVVGLGLLRRRGQSRTQSQVDS